MSKLHTITRRIEIDAGHRVPHHGSKCFNLHGHRYVIEAECAGPLAEDGEQTGMVLDFGFLKAAMVSEIDEQCDHTFIFAWWDDLCLHMFLGDQPRPHIEHEIRHAFGGVLVRYKPDGSDKELCYYVTNFSPTAENLARHWFGRLAPKVRDLSKGRATLQSIRVHETPNCMAEYRPGIPGIHVIGRPTTG